MLLSQRFNCCMLLYKVSIVSANQFFALNITCGKCHLSFRDNVINIITDAVISWSLSKFKSLIGNN